MKSLFGGRKRVVSNSEKGDGKAGIDGPWRGSQNSLVSNTGAENHPTSIHKCAKLGDIEGIDLLLKQRKKKAAKYVNSYDEEGLAPLHIAAKFNNIKVVKHLVEKCNADVVVQDKNDFCTPLHYAAKKRETGDSDIPEDIIKYLAMKMNEVGIDPNVVDKYQSTPLHFAAMRGNVTITSAFLGLKKINVNVKGHSDSTPLHDAVIYNNIDIVKLLLNKGANVECVDEEKTTVLHLAAMDGNLDMVKLLVESTPEQKQQAFIEAKDKLGNMALHLAVENKNTSVVNYLLETNMSESVVNRFCRPTTTKSTPLHLAAVCGSIDIINLLLKKGADVHLTDGDGMTCLHRAVEFEHLTIVKILLEHNANLESQDEEMFTPLLLACCGDNTQTSADIIKELLRNGANIHAVDGNENTALRLCTQYNNVAGMKVILKWLKKNNNLHFIDNAEKSGNTPLHLGCRWGRDEITQLLLNSNAGWHFKNEEEETAFHLAALNGHEKCCEILLKHTDNKVLNDEDEDSNTALHLASKAGFLNVVKLLADEGSDKESRNMDMWTPLDFAASEGHTDIVKFLLSEDVPVNPADKEGTTPLHLGCRYGHLDTVNLLLQSGARVGDKDAEGQNALDIAINNNHHDVAAAIVESNGWMDALMSDSIGKKGRDTPLRKLVRKMPNVAKMVLDKCMSIEPEGVSPEDRKAYIAFNFEIVDDTFSIWDKETGLENLASQDDVYDKKGNLLTNASILPYHKNVSHIKNNHLLMLMVKHSDGKGDLLFHPVMLSLIRHKWNRASILYYIFIIFYSMFLAMLSAYTTVTTPPYLIGNITECQNNNVNYQGTFERIATVLLYILCVCGILLELFQIWAIRSKYLELNNLLDWFTYVSTIFIITPFGDCGARNASQWQLAAFTVFIAWLDFLLFLRRLPRAGLYVVMIAEIFKTFMKFFVIFFLFIVAFAFSFNILLRNMAPFSNVHYAIIKMWVMMIGEFDFDTIFHPPDKNAPDALKYEAMTYTLFIFFLILMAIIVMNLLTGLAVDDVGVLQANAMLKKVTMQIELALDVEVALPYWVQRRAGFVKRGLKLHHNKDGNPFLKAIRRVLEGNFLSKENVCDKAVEKAMENDPDQEKKEFQEKIMKKFKKQKEELLNLKEQMSRIEGMLVQLLTKKEKKKNRKSVTPAVEYIENDDFL